MEDAIDHIFKYTAQGIQMASTQDEANARHFITEVNSAAVYVNASTATSQTVHGLGLGAGVAVSAQRLHARGPMGLLEN